MRPRSPPSESHSNPQVPHVLQYPGGGLAIPLHPPRAILSLLGKRFIGGDFAADDRAIRKISHPVPPHGRHLQVQQSGAMVRGPQIPPLQIPQRGGWEGGAAGGNCAALADGGHDAIILGNDIQPNLVLPGNEDVTVGLLGVGAGLVGWTTTIFACAAMRAGVVSGLELGDLPDGEWVSDRLDVGVPLRHARPLLRDVKQLLHHVRVLVHDVKLPVHDVRVLVHDVELPVHDVRVLVRDVRAPVHNGTDSQCARHGKALPPPRVD